MIKNILNLSFLSLFISVMMFSCTQKEETSEKKHEKTAEERQEKSSSKETEEGILVVTLNGERFESTEFEDLRSSWMTDDIIAEMGINEKTYYQLLLKSSGSNTMRVTVKFYGQEVNNKEITGTYRIGASMPEPETSTFYVDYIYEKDKLMEYYKVIEGTVVAEKITPQTIKFNVIGKALDNNRILEGKEPIEIPIKIEIDIKNIKKR